MLFVAVARSALGQSTTSSPSYQTETWSTVGLAQGSDIGFQPRVLPTGRTASYGDAVSALNTRPEGAQGGGGGSSAPDAYWAPLCVAVLWSPPWSKSGQPAPRTLLGREPALQGLLRHQGRPRRVPVTSLGAVGTHGKSV